MVLVGLPQGMTVVKKGNGVSGISLQQLPMFYGLIKIEGPVLDILGQL